MKPNPLSVILYLKELSSIADVIRAFASVFDTTVCLYEEPEDYQKAGVVIENIWEADKGFRVCVETLIMNPGKVGVTSEIEAGQKLAKALNQELVVSDEGANPYSWIWIDPEGQAWSISQIPNDADDLILNEATKTRME